MAQFHSSVLASPDARDAANVIAARLAFQALYLSESASY
jgi:hypothetical protein